MKKFNENFFEIIDSEEKAYWLGFIAADGCIHIQLRKNRPKPNFLIILSLAEKDLNHLIKYKESLMAKNLINKIYYEEKNKYSYNIRLVSEKMYNDLIDKGIMPRKSLTLKPPLNVPESLIRHWIRGYFDGDGCISFYSNRSNKAIRFNLVGTEEVLAFILNKVKLNLKIKPVKNSYIIRSSYSKAIKFLSFLYNNSEVFLERKFLKFQEVLS